jgi:hypothetical protein
MHHDELCEGKKLIRGLKTAGGAGFLRAYWKKKTHEVGLFYCPNGIIRKVYGCVYS